MMAKCEYMGKSEKKKNIDEPTSNVHKSTYIFNIQSAIKKPRDVNCLSSTIFYHWNIQRQMLCSLKAKYPEEEMHTMMALVVIGWAMYVYIESNIKFC